jgi:hypothetical protein
MLGKRLDAGGYRGGVGRWPRDALAHQLDDSYSLLMLVWINGPFGVGKTHTAHEIRRRLAGSIVCDPELLGFGLHRMMPPALRGDFQDLEAWRHGVYEVRDLPVRAHA